MSFRRIPKQIDPRRPPKRRDDRSRDADEPAEARSYGQYIDVAQEGLTELERASGEVAREGKPDDLNEEEGAAARLQRRAVKEREQFEEATDEVSREDGNVGW